MFERLGKLFQPATDQGDPHKDPDSGEDSSGHASSSPGRDIVNGAWQCTELNGHEVEVFEPNQATAPTACILFLHGHGRVMLSENEVFSSLLAKNNLAAVAPDGGRSWWLDEICSDFSAEHTPHQYLLESVLPFIESRWQITPPAIGLLGISMGGQGVLQLSYRHARTFPNVAAISPAVDFHVLHGHGLPLDEMFRTSEDARQATVVLNLHPLDWPRHQWFCCDPKDVDWFDGCARLGMKLSSSGILHERDLDTSAGGHTWEYFNHMAPAAIEHLVRGFASTAAG
ncbi:MAG: hypothetical protein Fues2KO_10820 [Fuerstiella sp.]